MLVSCEFIEALTNSSSKAHQSTARQYIVALNKAQETYYQEKRKFAHSFDDLPPAVKPNEQNPNYRYTKNRYDYLLTVNPQTVFSYARSRKVFQKSLVGGIFVVNSKTGKTQAIICEVNKPGKIMPTIPIYEKGILSCGANTTAVNLSSR